MDVTGTGPLSAQPPPAPTARWRQTFPGDQRELRSLRRWLESVLTPCPARDDVLSVATELGANAIAHTLSGQGGKFTVEVTWQPGVVRVAVADDGAPDAPRVIEDLSGESGRGLLMVRGLSLRSEVSGDTRGRVVWADIAWDGAAGDVPWRVLALAALAGFPDGAGVARLARLLASGARDYNSAYRRVYRALRAGEDQGHVHRTYQARPHLPFAWGQAETTGYGRPAITWQLTPGGASYLADWNQAHGKDP